MERLSSSNGVSFLHPYSLLALLFSLFRPYLHYMAILMDSVAVKTAGIVEWQEEDESIEKDSTPPSLIRGVARGLNSRAPPKKPPKDGGGQHN